MGQRSPGSQSLADMARPGQAGRLCSTPGWTGDLQGLLPGRIADHGIGTEIESTGTRRLSHARRLPGASASPAARRAQPAEASLMTRSCVATDRSLSESHDVLHHLDAHRCAGPGSSGTRNRPAIKRSSEYGWRASARGIPLGSADMPMVTAARMREQTGAARSAASWTDHITEPPLTRRRHDCGGTRSRMTEASGCGA